MDSQIKVRGNRVNITEVEKIVQSIESVDKGIVLCYHTGKKDQLIIAFVVLKNDTGSPSSQKGFEIEKILKSKLMDYQVPQIKVIKSIPLLCNGKIDRETLLKFYENNHTESR